MLNRFRNIAVGLLLIGAFFLASWFIPQEMLSNVISSLLIGIAIAVIWTYGKIGIPAAFSRSFGVVEQLAIGITISWAGVGVGAALRLYSRVANVEAAVANGLLIAFVTYCIGLGGVLHLTAPTSEPEPDIRRNWWALVFAIATGALIAGVLIGAELAGGVDRMLKT